MNFNWSDLATNVVFPLMVSGLTWLFTSVLKLRRDMDAAFRKIRQLEGEEHGPE